MFRVPIRQGRSFPRVPVVQVGIFIVGLDSRSTTSFPLRLAIIFTLGSLAIFPPPRLVLVIRVILFVLHPQPFGFFNEGSLITFIQQS